VVERPGANERNEAIQDLLLSLGPAASATPGKLPCTLGVRVGSKNETANAVAALRGSTSIRSPTSDQPGGRQIRVLHVL
jgi:hypothetical protein